MDHDRATLKGLVGRRLSFAAFELKLMTRRLHVLIMTTRLPPPQRRLIILNNGQMMRTAKKSAFHSPNFHSPM
ncbi:hypothetical protein TNCV_2267911 [Trichonephila clavipes]|nr:hypothetical protein TNCV_2267911 [Trichonephila clavipes]